MRAIGWAQLVVAASCVLGCPAPGSGAPRVPRAAFAAAADWTCMWWAYGLRDDRKVFRIRTSRYTLAFDYAKFDLTHLSLPPSAPEEAAAWKRGQDALGKPDASLACIIEADGREYRAVPPARVDTRNCHLIESGRFFQRRYLEDLAWAPGAPKVDSGLEIAAWPDRLMLLLRVAPARAIRRGALRLALRLGGRARKPSAARGPLLFRLPVGDWPAGQEKELAVVLRPGSRGMEAMRADTEPPPREAVTVAAGQIAPATADVPVAYDRKLGWHYVALRNDVPDNTPAGRNRRIERVALTITNPAASPRPVRLCLGKTNTFGIVGLSAMLRDADGDPTGIPVQVSKNWHKGRAPGRYQGPWTRALTMLTVPAGTTLKLEYTSVNALWGGVPAASHAQLCLTGWGSNQLWHEAAIGSWGESLCFEPDQGQRGGAVLDTRPLMVWSMGKRPKRKWRWTHNVGGADFLVYYDRPGRKQWHSRMKARIRRHGPVLTEATYAGQTHDGKIDLRYTVGLYRTDDLTRGLYRFRCDVRRPAAFDRLVLFQCGGDHYSYTGERTFARGSEAGLIEEWPTTWGGNVYRTKPVEAPGRVPWFSMHQAVRREKDAGAWANRGIVIRRWEARLGGRPARPWSAERGARVRGRDTSLIDILPPPDVRDLKAGDFVDAVVEHVVIPQFAADYYGPNASLRAALKSGANTWEMVFREAVGNDLKVAVARGKLVRVRPTMIRTAGNRAEFAVTGGLGYVPITLTGLSDYRRPILEIRDGDGPWRRVDQSDHGSDFWQADYDAAARTWDVTYSVPLDTPADAPRKRRFRFRLGGEAPRGAALSGAGDGIQSSRTPVTPGAPGWPGVGLRNPRWGGSALFAGLEWELD